MRKITAATFVGGWALLALAACGDSLGPSADTDLQEIVGSVAAGDAAAQLRAGSPSTDASAPSATVDGNTSVIPGGGARFTITADDDFRVVYLWVEGRTGYYEVDLGSARAAADIIVTLGEALQQAGYGFGFAVGTGGGAGQAAEHQTEVVDVATGDVQVSVAWDVPSDVDLYVVEPSGETIYYGNRASASGGQLDLDSNAACGGRDVRNENITWPDDAPPRGEYEVRVNYWSACNQPATNYVVTVRVAGQPTRSYEGRFTGSGVGGAQNAGEVITTFTY